MPIYRAMRVMRVEAETELDAAEVFKSAIEQELKHEMFIEVIGDYYESTDRRKSFIATAGKPVISLIDWITNDIAERKRVAEEKDPSANSEEPKL